MPRVIVSILLIIFTGIQLGLAQTNKILFFVAQEECYFSEYIVSIKALEAAGYTVEVRSCTNLPAASYMLPAGTTIEATANTMAGGSYSQFQQQFSQLFGSNWNAQWDTITPLIPTAGSILQVANMDAYDAFVLPGGTGTQAYRLDGTYDPQGSGSRLVPATTVQAVAEKLNALALDALSKGKPVLAQCHGAALPVFWRIPNTTGSGNEALGYSLLKNQSAAGFPDPATGTIYFGMNVAYRAADPIRISALHASFSGKRQGDYRIITSRDWYPQTVAHATRALLNMLRSYPSVQLPTQTLNILILHGGAVDTNNCSPANLLNDIPCNHAGVRPADYTHLSSLLQQQSVDSFQFVVSDLNLSSTNLPFNLNDSASVGEYIRPYAGIIFFKHWATHVTDELQLALVRYADDGGGIVALHHGLYNREEAGNLSKNILVQQLFEAESNTVGFGVQLSPQLLLSSNAGHFVSTYAIPIVQGPVTPSLSWNQPPAQAVNHSGSSYPYIGINDELYNNMSYLPSANFGTGVNQILPLFSNNILGNVGVHTSGFVKRFNQNNDMREGKLAYLQPGERIVNYQLPEAYAQLIRNAVFWTARKTMGNNTAVPPIKREVSLQLYPNPASNELFVKSSQRGKWQITDLNGRAVSEWNVLEEETQINVQALQAGMYLIHCQFENGSQSTYRWIKAN